MQNFFLLTPLLYSRFDTLIKMWIEMEKLFVAQYKMKRKTTEKENLAMDTHAPTQLRDELVYNLLTGEMEKHMSSLRDFGKRRVWIEKQMQKVDIEDARAVVKGESREIKREKMVLVLPFFNLFTRVTKTVVLELVRSSHDKMDKFQKNMNRETGMALLQRADDVLNSLQKEIKSRRRASITVTQLDSMQYDMSQFRVKAGDADDGWMGDGDGDDEEDFDGEYDSDSDAELDGERNWGGSGRRQRITTFTSIASERSDPEEKRKENLYIDPKPPAQAKINKFQASRGRVRTKSNISDGARRGTLKLPDEDIDFTTMTNTVVLIGHHHG